MATQGDTVGPAPIANNESDKTTEKAKIDTSTSGSEDAPAAQDPRGIQVIQHEAIHQIWSKGPLIAVFAGWVPNQLLR